MTIREIAAIAGVSPAAVSLVMNNKKGVSEETRRRVLRGWDAAVKCARIWGRESGNA